MLPRHLVDALEVTLVVLAGVWIWSLFRRAPRSPDSVKPAAPVQLSGSLASRLRETEQALRRAERLGRELREELAHVNRLTMLDRLAASLAHEISQPLTAVMANTETALRLTETQPPRLVELRETLNEILSDNKRAGHVLLSMRTLLKKSASQYAPVEINGIVKEAVRLIHGHAARRRIEIDVDLSSDIQPVLCDRVQIQQVVINLLMNAFDAVQECDAADRRVKIRTSTRDLAALIEVSDRGAGLSDEALEVVFEPFYTTKRDGIGLGLFICRAIVAAHGGALGATQNPEAGMTFSASFPLVRPPAAAQAGWTVPGPVARQ